MHYRNNRRVASIKASFRSGGKVLPGKIVDFSYSGLSVLFDTRVAKGTKVALILSHSEHPGEVVHLDEHGRAGVKLAQLLSRTQHHELVTAARNGNRALMRGLSEL